MKSSQTPDIFISYAREDQEFIVQLKKNLRKKGYKTWIDSEDIRAGTDWRAEIDKGITDCRVMILIMSPDAKKSEYVTYEWAYALGTGKPVVVIVLENTELHSRLEILQHISFRKVHPWAKLYKELKYLMDEGEEPESSKTNNEVPDVIPAYISQAIADLDSIDSKKREHAIKMLKESKLEQSREALASAVQNHPLREVRFKAAFALAEKTNYSDVRALPGLFDALAKGGIRPPVKARDILRKMGVAILSELLDALPIENQQIFQGVQYALVNLGDSAMPGLLKALHNDDENIRLRALETLQKMGNNAVLDVFQVLRNDEDPNIRRLAVIILSPIRTPDSMTALITAFHDEDELVRSAAAEALWRTSSNSMSGLAKQLKSDNELVQQGAEKTFTQMWIQNIPALIEVLDDERLDRTSGLAITQALAEIAMIELPSIDKASQQLQSQARAAAEQWLKE